MGIVLPTLRGAWGSAAVLPHLHNIGTLCCSTTLAQAVQMDLLIAISCRWHEAEAFQDSKGIEVLWQSLGLVY